MSIPISINPLGLNKKSANVPSAENDFDILKISVNNIPEDGNDRSFLSGNFYRTTNTTYDEIMNESDGCGFGNEIWIRDDERYGIRFGGNGYEIYDVNSNYGLVFGYPDYLPLRPDGTEPFDGPWTIIEWTCAEIDFPDMPCAGLTINITIEKIGK